MGADLIGFGTEAEGEQDCGDAIGDDSDQRRTSMRAG